MATLKFTNDLQSHEKHLYAFAFNLTKDKEEAKDLYQETSFRALKNWEKFREGTNLKAWLFTIMRNMFITNYRQKVRTSVIIDSTPNLHFINLSNTEIVNQGESRMIMEELTMVLNKLEEKLRVPFVMHYEGYKYEEISEHLNKPVGTIKSRIFFARKRLKEMLEKNNLTVS